MAVPAGGSCPITTDPTQTIQYYNKACTTTVKINNDPTQTIQYYNTTYNTTVYITTKLTHRRQSNPIVNLLPGGDERLQQYI